MKFLASCFTVLVLTPGGLIPLGALGQLVADDHPDYVPISEFEALQKRFDDYERRLSVAENRPAPRPFCYPCSTHSGITFAAELTFLKAYQSEGSSDGLTHEEAPRISLGYTGEQGLGARVRWFDYQASGGASNSFSPITQLDMRVVDFELTDKFRIGHWNGVISGGLRYAEYQQISGTAPFSSTFNMEDSLGPVIGVELNRRVSDKLALFGIARASLQFTDDSLFFSFPATDIHFGIAEIQIGAERTIKEVNGGRLFVRGAFEAQRWSGGAIGGDSEDLGLVGGVISVGFAR